MISFTHLPLFFTLLLLYITASQYTWVADDRFLTGTPPLKPDKPFSNKSLIPITLASMRPTENESDLFSVAIIGTRGPLWSASLITPLGDTNSAVSRVGVSALRPACVGGLLIVNDTTFAIARVGVSALQPPCVGGLLIVNVQSVVIVPKSNIAVHVSSIHSTECNRASILLLLIHCGSGSEVSGILEWCRGSWFHLGSILHVRSQSSTTSLLASCTTEPARQPPPPLHVVMRVAFARLHAP
jgi:hypothetical protein